MNGTCVNLSSGDNVYVAASLAEVTAALDGGSPQTAAGLPPSSGLVALGSQLVAPAQIARVYATDLGDSSRLGVIPEQLSTSCPR